MQTIKHILIVLILFGILSSCNISNEEDCGGDGGIQVNQELYNEITVAVGETFSADLRGDPPVFSHPNDVPINVTYLSGADFSIADIWLDKNSTDGIILNVKGKSEGSFKFTLIARDDCSGERGQVGREFSVFVTNDNQKMKPEDQKFVYEPWKHSYSLLVVYLS